ncbi:MAG: LamG domain-containing protein, partial [Magnetococcus sp. YQC-3]
MGVDSPMSHRSNKTIAFALILFFTIILSSLVFSSGIPAGLNNGLVSYYRLNEISGSATVADSNLAGTSLNSSSGGQLGVPGIIKTGMNFETNNAFRTSTTGAPAGRWLYMLDNGANFTYTIWFKTSQAGAVDHWLFSKYDGGTDCGMWIYVDGGAIGKIRITRATDNLNYTRHTTNNTFNDGAWHFLLITSTNGSISIYVDDTNQAVTVTGVGAYTGCATNSDVIIGNNQNLNSSFDGNVDEWGFWQRDLNTQERSTLYAGGIAKTWPFFDYNISFNVYKTGTTTHLAGINVDCNDPIIDVNGVNSKFDLNIYEGSYTCDFNRSGYDGNVVSVFADSNKTINVELLEATPVKHKIDFNVMQMGTSTHLNNITMDCNDNIYDSSGNNSPYDVNMAAGSYLCSFSKSTYDTNSNWAILADSNKTIRIDLNVSSPPITTISVNYNGVVSSRDINITCTDAISGCKKNYWTINGGATQASASNPAGFVQTGIGTYSIQYWSEDNTDVNSSAQSYTLQIFGNAKIRVRDENSMGDLNSISLTSYDGNTYTINTLLNVDLNNASATSQQYTFSFSKAGYGSRTYSLDMNRFSSFDLNILLLPTSLTNNIKYKFYAPDETTILSNQYVELKHWLKDGNTCGRIKTNALGEATFNMNMRDANYHFYINNGTYDYNSFVLSVLKPRDEADGTIIDANWNILASGVGASVDTNISAASKALYVYPNTVATYILTISSENLDPVYLSRKYEVSYVGNPSSASLQPYLITSDSGTAIKLITQQDNGLTITAYPSINIKIYKNLPAGRTLVEETVTDTKGEALVTLVAADTYEF